MLEDYRKECVDVYKDINGIKTTNEVGRCVYPKSVLVAIMAAKTIAELSRVMTTARMRYL